MDTNEVTSVTAIFVPETKTGRFMTSMLPPRGERLSVRNVESMNVFLSRWQT